jgi:polyphosphate glucokinase
VEKLDWPAWIERVNVYLAQLHALFWPDLFILGGAVSERFNEFAPLLHSDARILPAQFAGQAGVIGAALAAAGE